MLLGANLGDPIQQFRSANLLIVSRIGPIIKQSDVYVSPSWGDVGIQPDYLNQAILVETSLEPTLVLEEILKIETELGRIRTVKWGARVIDIDILYIDDLIIDLPNLVVPHPLLQMRNFALLPMMDLNVNWVHPVLNLGVDQMIRLCSDTAKVVRLVDGSFKAN